MIAMPPSWAMAMAMRDSETVSIAAATSGMLRRIWREKRVAGVGLGGQHFGVARDQQHVVEGQAVFGQDFFACFHFRFLCLPPGILKAGAERVGFFFWRQSSISASLTGRNRNRKRSTSSSMRFSSASYIW